MLVMSTYARSVLVFTYLFLTMAPGLSFADFTYTYTGEDYSGDTNGAFISTPASPPRVSGSFTVSSPLLPNSNVNLKSSSNLVGYSFNNGLETINKSNGEIYYFQINTDADGEIARTYIQVQKWESTAAINSYLNDIEIVYPPQPNKTHEHVECIAIQLNACIGIRVVSNVSSYAVWGTGVWQSPLQVVAAQNPIYVSSSTSLSTRGGNGSTGTVSYHLASGPCSLSENILTGTATGECIVTATKESDGSHVQETSAPTTISVTPPPPLLVTAQENPIQVMGSTTLSTAGGNGSTGIVTYQLLSGPCSLNENEITGTGLGVCVVTATQASDTFHPQMTSAPLAISVSLPPQSSLTLSAYPSSIRPGQTTNLTTNGGSGSGSVTYQLLSGPCTLSGSVLTASAVGSCVAKATKAGDSDYLPITSDPLTVAVSLTPQLWSSPPSNLSLPTGGFPDDNAQLALSGEGTRAAAVWWIYDDTNGKVQFSWATINGDSAQWTAPIDISPPGVDAWQPKIALSEDGRKAIVTWISNAGDNQVIQSAIATINDTGADFGNTSILPTTGVISDYTNVSISANGTKAIAIWTHYADSGYSIIQSSVATINGNTVTWGTSYNISTLGTDNWNPQVLLSKDGSLSTAMWIHNDGSNAIIQSASASLSGTSAIWGNPVNLSATGADADEPSFSLSGDGTKALSMWRQIKGRNAIFQSSSGTINGSIGFWGAPVDLSQPSLNTYSSQVTISEDGEKGAAIWIRSNADFELVESATVSLADNGTSWSSPIILSQENHNSYLPSITISQDGTKATAIWTDGFGDIYSIQSTSASIIDNRATWGGAGTVSPTNENIYIYPKITLSKDGTKATALWNVFSFINEASLIQSSSASILYPSLSPSSQTIHGSIGVAITPTEAFTYQGLYGIVSYSASPALPAGLLLNSANGVISGISYSALAPSTYILTGTGSLGGTATATVVVEIPEGPPIVTNLVATPGPGPSIILSFNTQAASMNMEARTTAAVLYTGTCTSNDGGSTAMGTGYSSPISVPGVTAGKIYSCVVTGSDGSGSSTSTPSNAVIPGPPPHPNPIPTLPDFARSVMALFFLFIIMRLRRWSPS